MIPETRMGVFISVLVSLLTLVPLPHAEEPSAPPRPTKRSEESMYSRVISETKVAGLAALLEECRGYEPKSKEVLIGLFLKGLDSRSRAVIDQASPANSDDLSTVRGRCAHFSRELLDIDFPPIQLATSKADLQKAKMAIINKVIEERLKKRDADVAEARESVAGKALDERLLLARNKATNEVMLAALARDTAVDVRIAVAQNGRTPLYVIDDLLKDKDDGVVKAAFENLKRSRTIEFSPRQ